MKRWGIVLGVLLVVLFNSFTVVAQAKACVVSGGIIVFGISGIEDQFEVRLVDPATNQVVASSTDWEPGSVAGTTLFKLPPAMADKNTLIQLVRNGRVIQTLNLYTVLANAQQPGTNMPVNNCIGGFIGDGRINDGGDQLAAPLAGYCTDEDGIEVWDISADGVGDKDFTVTAADITAALALAAETTVNQIVGSGALGNQLWALTSGELQFHGPGLPGEEGKIYDYIFAGDFCA